MPKMQLNEAAAEVSIPLTGPRAGEFYILHEPSWEEGEQINKLCRAANDEAARLDEPPKRGAKADPTAPEPIPPYLTLFLQIADMLGDEGVDRPDKSCVPVWAGEVNAVNTILAFFRAPLAGQGVAEFQAMLKKALTPPA